ncbi:MAG: FHA domain-containing protein [Thermoguttaceae bacterium]|nr:FHA domain-containing protein [Thermoguttaceae bacterium]
MAKYKCPDCGSEEFDGKVCKACNYKKKSRLQLTGPHGSITLRITTRIGRSSMTALLGDNKRFYASFQFELDFSKEDAGWVLTAQPGTVNNTLVNGFVCEPGVRYLLQSGDVIALGSKSGSGKTGGEVKVHLVD